VKFSREVAAGVISSLIASAIIAAASAVGSWRYSPWRSLEIAGMWFFGLVGLGGTVAMGWYMVDDVRKRDWGEALRTGGLLFFCLLWTLACAFVIANSA